MQSEIEKTINYNQILGMVCIDLVKAYDTTWRPRIIYKFKDILCEGNVLNFIISFLTDRSFQIKYNSTLSNVFIQ